MIYGWRAPLPRMRLNERRKPRKSTRIMQFHTLLCDDEARNAAAIVVATFCHFPPWPKGFDFRVLHVFCLTVEAGKQENKCTRRVESCMHGRARSYTVSEERGREQGMQICIAN
jgi:hypothetical protein